MDPPPYEEDVLPAYTPRDNKDLEQLRKYKATARRLTTCTIIFWLLALIIAGLMVWLYTGDEADRAGFATASNGHLELICDVLGVEADRIVFEVPTCMRSWRQPSLDLHPAPGRRPCWTDVPDPADGSAISYCSETAYISVVQGIDLGYNYNATSTILIVSLVLTTVVAGLGSLIKWHLDPAYYP